MTDHYERLGYDLWAAIEENSNCGITHREIKEVLAVFEGENDEYDWRWIVSTKNGAYADIQGGCDYTGWDCQSWCGASFYVTVEEAINSSDYQQEHLRKQLVEGKYLTWAEKKAEEFKDIPIVDSLDDI